MDYVIRNTDDPQPKQISTAAVHLGTKLVKDGARASAKERASVVILELDVLLSLESFHVWRLRLHSCWYLVSFAFLLELLQFLGCLFLVRIVLLRVIVIRVLALLILHNFVVNSIILCSWTFLEAFAAVMDNQDFLRVIIHVLVVVRSVRVDEIALDICILALVKPFARQVKMSTAIDEDQTPQEL